MNKVKTFWPQEAYYLLEKLVIKNKQTQNNNDM